MRWMPVKAREGLGIIFNQAPTAGRVIPANPERYNQVAKVTRHAIAAVRKRFAGSTPVRSSIYL